MGSAFTKTDWEFVRNRAISIKAQLRAKGQPVDHFLPGDFEPLPHIPMSQIEEFYSQTGYAFPNDFVDLVTKFAGGWRFYWSLCISQTPFKCLEPPVYLGNFGGSSEAPFIGASKDNTLLKIYGEFQRNLSQHYRRPSEQIEIDPALFPLNDFEGGEGDMTVMRLDRIPTEIHFLDHEGGHCVYEKDLIGLGFREFVLSWADLGFPGCDYHRSWVNRQTHQPDHLSAKANAWRAWLADPNANGLVDSQGMDLPPQQRKEI